MTNAQQNLQPPMAFRRRCLETQMHRPKETTLFWPSRFRRKSRFTNQERAVVEQMTACSLIGSPESVDFQLKQLRERVHFDEIMAVSLF